MTNAFPTSATAPMTDSSSGMATRSAVSPNTPHVTLPVKLYPVGPVSFISSKYMTADRLASVTTAMNASNTRPT